MKRKKILRTGVPKNKHVIVMVLCFIFAGYFLLNYVSQTYIAINMSSPFNRTTIRINETEDSTPVDRATMHGDLQLKRFFSTNQLINLLTGVMFIVAGATIGEISREKEIRRITENVTGLILLPEEKIIVDILRKKEDGATQKELVMETGLSRVKVHRILGKLENRKIIKRHPYGLTKKVMLVKKH